jgi:hypothetical protein
MSGIPLLGSVQTSAGAGDVVYFPLFKKSADSAAHSKHFYPAAGLPRLPLAFGELKACLDQLDSLVQTCQKEVYDNAQTALWWWWMSCGKWSLAVVMFLLFTQISQQSTIALMCIPVGVICAVNLCCVCYCKDDLNRDKLQKALEQDLFHSVGTCTQQRIEAKLAELGDQYNVRFDLLSSAHCVDKRHPGRQFLSSDDAWAQKLAFDNDHVNGNSGPQPPGFLVYCVALRPRQAPSAPPPPLPPIWLQDVNPSVDVINVAADLTFQSQVSTVDIRPSYSDAAVAQCAAEIENLQGDEFLKNVKKCPRLTAALVLGLGGMCVVGQGRLHVVLGVGCLSSEAIAHGCRQHGSPTMWLAFFCVVCAWLGAVLWLWFGNQGDPMTPLLEKVAGINKRNASTGLTLHVSVETAVRVKCCATGSQSGARHTMEFAIEPEPVIFAWRQ